MFEAFDASGSALRAERVRLTAIANNLANVYTTRNEFGEREPFKRKLVVLMEGNPENSNPNLGVRVDDIVEDNAAPRLVWDPNHPDAIKEDEFFVRDEDGILTEQRKPEYAHLDDEGFRRVRDKIGYVEYPNVDPVKEMSDAMLARRAYQANVTAIEVSKSLIQESLQIIS